MGWIWTILIGFWSAYWQNFAPGQRQSGLHHDHPIGHRRLRCPARLVNHWAGTARDKARASLASVVVAFLLLWIYGKVRSKA